MSNPLLKELRCSKYRILGLVGQGQFGRVYCASHRKTGRLVALKELDKERFPTHKFLRELRFLLSLQHTNIVSCQALEHTATGRYLVMDYCEGGTLRNLIEEDVRLHPAQGLKLVLDVLAGLEHAHNRGIIHCDIKPENILLTVQANGWLARISDFGIARLSQEISKDGTGNTGSPAYMAPERFYGQHFQSSDLYAVGVLLFELLTGYRPFSGLPAELMSAHLNHPLKIPETIPAELRIILQTALQKLPARRYHSALEMHRAVEAAAATLAPNLTNNWQDGSLLKPANQSSACAFVFSQKEPLSTVVRQLVVAPDEYISGSPQPNRIRSQKYYSNPASDPPLHQIYQICDHRVGRQTYAAGTLTSTSATLTTVRLPEAIQELLVRPQGCFAVTERSVYLLPDESFKPDIRPDTAPPDPKPLQQKKVSPTLPRPIVPQLIAEFSTDFVATIAPGGEWMATAALEPNQANSSLRIWHLSQMQPIKPVRHSLAYLFQLLALDSRHFATFSHNVDCQTNTCITGLTIAGFTRRGIPIGALHLPLPLQRVIPTLTPYRLLALEPGRPNSIVLLDLKPLRLNRLGVEIAPTLVAATTWGYVLVADDGQIVLLDKYGQSVGRIGGPANPTAIALPTPHILILATWSNDQGYLYTVDLQQLDLEILF